MQGNSLLAFGLDQIGVDDRLILEFGSAIVDDDLPGALVCGIRLRTKKRCGDRG
jgi:hypothetical protein